MKVLVLAGGFDQIALINELKSYGHQILLADYIENPPAKGYVDQHFRISTLDEKAVFQLVLREKVELLTTVCTDQALLTVARVSEKLGLPCYISSKKALQVTNKYYMKKMFLEFGIPSASFLLLDNENKWKTQIGRMIFPSVVKPCDCNSSKGVIKVKNKEELINAIETAFKLSRSKKVIVEEFIEGEEVSIDVWVDNIEAKVLSVSETSKIEDNSDAFTIFQSRYPVEKIDAVKHQIYDIAQNISDVFELKNCPLLIQALIRDGKVYVIEFSARMGGGSKYKLIEYMSGVNIMKTYMKRILGDEHQIITPIWSRKKIELNYIYAYNGTVEEIIGMQELKDNGIVKDYFIYKPLGSIIEKRTTSSDRVLGFLVEADSFEKVKELRNVALENIEIRDNGKNIMYKNCYNTLR